MLKKKSIQGVGYSSMVEYLPTKGKTPKTLSSTLSNAQKTKQNNHEYQ